MVHFDSVYVFWPPDHVRGRDLLGAVCTGGGVDPHSRVIHLLLSVCVCARAQMLKAEKQTLTPDIDSASKENSSFVYNGEPHYSP